MWKQNWKKDEEMFRRNRTDGRDGPRVVLQIHVGSVVYLRFWTFLQHCAENALCRFPFNNNDDSAPPKGGHGRARNCARAFACASARCPTKYHPSNTQTRDDFSHSRSPTKSRRHSSFFFNELGCVAVLWAEGITVTSHLT